MANPTRNDTSHRKPEDESDDNSKGQYGGLTGLGPGGGEPLEEALETEDIEPDTDETGRTPA